jgi:hypothetical protein
MGGGEGENSRFTEEANTVIQVRNDIWLGKQW